MTAAGLVVEVLGIRPARTDNHLVLIFLTIGLSIFLRGVMKLIWGKNRLAVPPLAGEAPVQVLGATILPQTLWILALTGVAIVLLVLFFRKTSLGLAMRAVAANEQAARVVGLNVGRVKALSFALAGALGGLAGCLVTPITTLAYDVGVLLGLKGFAAAILGGFGSFPGAIIGGITLGLLESLTAGYLSSAYKDVVAFVVLLLVLFVRPRGLLGGRIKFNDFARAWGFSIYPVVNFPPFLKGGSGGIILACCPTTEASRNSRELRKNMTEAETVLWRKTGERQLNNCRVHQTENHRQLYWILVLLSN